MTRWLPVSHYTFYFLLIYVGMFLAVHLQSVRNSVILRTVASVAFVGFLQNWRWGASSVITRHLVTKSTLFGTTAGKKVSIICTAALHACL